LTTAFCIMVPVFILLRIKNWATFLILFPIVYIIYSFVAPLAFIIGPEFESITRAFLVSYKIFSIENKEYIYVAHAAFLVFYLTWFAGFFFAYRWRYKAITYIKEINLEPLKLRGIIFLVSCILGFLTIFLIYKEFGFNFSIIYGRGTKILYAKYKTLFGALFSLWGSSIICFAASVFLYIRKTGKMFPLELSMLILQILFYIAFSFLRGDRSQLFVVLLAVVVLYSYVLKPVKISFQFLIYLFFLVFIFYIIGRFRGEKLSHIGELARIVTSSEFLRMFVYPFVSVESFAAYTALPFLIANEIPLLRGQSIAFFFIDLLPRAIAPFRPPSEYTYTKYAEYAGILNIGQGFTFHHVADWYWNFSWVGVVLGGFLIGYLLAKLEKKALTSSNIFWVVVFSSTLGHLPNSMRAPIEGFRAIFYEYWLLPFLFFVLIPHFLRMIRGCPMKKETKF